MKTEPRTRLASLRPLRPKDTAKEGRYQSKRKEAHKKDARRRRKSPGSSGVEGALSGMLV